MARTKTRTKSGRQLPANKTAYKASSSPPKKPEPTAAALLEKTQDLLARCEYELAAKFIDRILSQSPNNVEARELKGVVEIETGELDAARKTFTLLLEINNSSVSSSAHLHLAQLSEEDPRLALTHYQAAVDILASHLKGKDRANDVTQLSEEEAKRTAIRALVSMVEIYMTDLCFEPEAESQCESYLNIAMQIDCKSPETLQSLASVRMSQSKPEEAAVFAERAWEGWRDVGNDIASSPSPTALLSLTRIFLELSMFSRGLEVLQAIFSVDDEDVEAWYLQGWCFVLMAERVKETNERLEELGWTELSQDARDCLETCRALHARQEHPDVDLLQHVEELISELETAGVHISPPDEAPDEEADEEDEWTDEEGDIEMRG